MTSNKLRTFAFALVAMVGCATDPTESQDWPEDGSDDALVDGKADGVSLADGTPEACGVLNVANTASYDELHAGVHLTKRVSNNIISGRTYATIAELDAVPYVGPVALANLAHYATAHGDVAACTTMPPPPPDCTGVTVPGDYASLQTALDAVANAGQDATICLGEGTLAGTNGEFQIYDPTHSHGKALHIVGRSRDLTHLAGTVTTSNGGWASVTIEHLTIDAPNKMSLTVLYGPAHFVASDVRLTGALAIDVTYVGLVDATIDRCEIGTQQEGESVRVVNDEKGVSARITNSYLHGKLISETWNQGLHGTLALINNTIVGASTGIDLEGELTATVANNIITGATAFAIAWDANTTVTSRNNALWGNAANYGRYATEGTSTVKADCHLDGRTPVPGTGAGSPCRGAADASVAPATDFYGTTRGGAADIGAVEAP